MTTDSPSLPQPASPLPARTVVRYELEARARGFPTPRAFRTWCRRHGVPLYRDGKALAVVVADVDAAYAKITRREQPSDAVREALGRITGGAR